MTIMFGLRLRRHLIRETGSAHWLRGSEGRGSEGREIGIHPHSPGSPGSVASGQVSGHGGMKRCVSLEAVSLALPWKRGGGWLVNVRVLRRNPRDLHRLGR